MGRRRPLRFAQDGEAIPQPVQNLLDRQGLETDGGQLDRQRDTVQPATELGGGLSIVRIEILARDRGGSAGEQLDGLGLDRTGIRDRHGRHAKDGLRVDGEGAPAGRQHVQPAAGPKEGVDEQRAGVDEVLAVVQDDQEPSLPEALCEVLDGPARGRVVEAEGPRHLLREQRGIAEAGELDDPHAVAEATADVLGDPEREPRLPDPGRPGEGHEPRGGQAAPNLGDLPPSADERASLRWNRSWSDAGHAHTSIVADPIEVPAPTIRYPVRSSPDDCRARVL